MRIFLAGLAVLALTSCDNIGAITGPVASVPTAPVVVADKTVLDERAGIAVETAYKAWRVAVELAVDSGVLKGPLAARIAEIDNRAYTATLAMQAAYKAGNATGYIVAGREANTAIRLGIDAIRGATK